MRRIILLCCALALLLAAAVTAQQAGCCCDTQGRAQKASILTADDCDTAAGFSFQQPPDSFFIGKNVQNVCADFCGQAVGGEIVAPEVGCGSPDYLPPPGDLRIQPVKGQPRIRLNWEQNCTAFVNAITISRCKGADCRGGSELAVLAGGSTFLDPEELEFGEVYTYHLKTTFTVGKSEEVSVSGTPGDIECSGIVDDRTFCVSSLYYENFRDYFQTNGYKDTSPSAFGQSTFNQTITELFFSKFNKGMSCSDLNQVFAKKTCPDDKGDLCIIDDTAPAGAICASSEDCRLKSPGHFGLNFTVETCEGTLDQRSFCFLDKSKSVADQCYNCVQGMSCYDYRSRGACERNNCGAGDCAWKDVFPEIGVGVCLDTRFDNCKLCTSRGTPGIDNQEAFNDIFDQCSEAKALALSTDEKVCFFDARTGAAAGCDDVDCTALTQTQCGSPSGGIKLDAQNNIVAKSTDACGIGVCQYDPSVGCAKNADGKAPEGDFRDCAGLEGRARDDCEGDRYPPETSLLAVRSAKGVVDEIQIIRRDKEIASELPVKVRGDGYKTYFCVGDGCSDFQSYTQDKLFVDNLFLQKIGEGGKPEIFAVMQEGQNTIRYYSEDKNHNVEVVQSLAFNACAACQGPKLLNASLSNERIHDDVHYTRDASPQITLFFNKAVTIITSDIKRGELTLGAGSSPQGSIVTITPSQPLDDGEYTLEVMAQDDQGITMDEPVTVDFVVDTTPPTVDILINNNATPGVIVRQTSAQVSLNFSEEVEVTSAVLTSKNFTRFTVQDIDENLTDRFQGSQTLMTASITPMEGENILKLKAEDLAGHQVEAPPHPFRIYTGPPKIRLISPSFEVAPDFAFPIEVETQNPAECRFWFSAADPVIPPPGDFGALEEFDLTGFTDHVKNNIQRIKEELTEYPLLVRCTDDLGGESQEQFLLSVDTTPPSIISAFAEPDPVIQKPFVTALKVQTDDETFCKASKSATSYGAMELKFPGFEQEGATVHEMQVTEDELGSKLYHISCINLAELGPAAQDVSFDILEGQPFQITSNTPRYTQQFEFSLAVQTNKDATCYYTEDPDQLGEKLGEAEGLSKIHVTPVVVEGEGAYSYYVTCSTGGANVIGGEPETAQLQVNVSVDTTPPRMVEVNDDSPLFADKEISYFRDHIRAKWIGEDDASGVKKYFYRVRDASSGATVVPDTPSDKTDYYVDIYFDVQDKARYQVDARAVDGVALESDTLSSDGVSVDFSREPPHCVNGIFEPDAGEVDKDCGGECYKCKADQQCTTNQDCVSDFCQQGICVAALCDDGLKNGRETDVDCGGQCGDCSKGASCLVDRDCATRYCSPDNVCEQAPPCANHILDGTETDIDCGGACPDRCGSGAHCKIDADCIAGSLCLDDQDSGVKTCFGEGELPGSLAKDKDSDADGLPDWYEEKYSIDDPDADDDGDGLTNREEYEYFLKTGREISPILYDSDGDGWSDIDEISLGFNPVNSADYPQSTWWKWLALLIGIVGFGLVGYYGYKEYQEFQRQRALQQELPVRHHQEQGPSPRDLITQQAEKIKRLLGNKQTEDFMDVEDIQKQSRKEQEERKRHEEMVFSQLTDVREGKPLKRKARKSAIGDLRGFKKTKVSKPEKNQAFDKLSMLKGWKDMTPKQREEMARKLKQLSTGVSQTKRKKLLDDLKMTASFYQKHKEDLASEAEQWYEKKTKVSVEKNRKGKKEKKDE